MCRDLSHGGRPRLSAGTQTGRRVVAADSVLRTPYRCGHDRLIQPNSPRDWLERLGTTKELDLHELVERQDPLMVFPPPRGIYAEGLLVLPLPGSSLVGSADGVRVDLTARLVPTGHGPDSTSVGVIERHFDTVGGWARHEKLELPSQWVGQGRGRALTRESALLYEQLGIREVTLNAVDYGRYVWGHVRIRLPRARRTHLGPRRDGGLRRGAWATSRRLGVVRALVDIGSMEGDALTMWQIASATGEEIEDSPETADSLGEEILPGKALLLFSDYEGYEAVLRLGAEADPIGRDQLLYYTDV